MVSKRFLAALPHSINKLYHKARSKYRKLKPKYRYSVTAAGVMLVAIAVVGLYIQVRAAPDLSDNWNFSNPNNYVMSDGLETSGSSVRLKSCGYSLAANNDSNSQAYYNFDQTDQTGNAFTDNSGNGNVLTGVGTTATTSGCPNNAANFAGSNYLTAPDSTSLALGSNQSIEAMIKLGGGFSSSSANDEYITDKGGYKLYLDHGTGKLTYELASNSTSRNTLAGPWVTSSGSSGSGMTAVHDQIKYNTDIYYSVGDGTTDSGVWRLDTASNTKQRIGASYVTGTLSNATIASNGSTLYVAYNGYNGSAYYSNVFSCDMSTQCQTFNSLGTVPGNGYGLVISLYYQNGNLLAGTYNSGSGGVAALYIYNGAGGWNLIGGTGSSPSSWTSAQYADVHVTGDGSNTLYVD